MSSLFRSVSTSRLSAAAAFVALGSVALSSTAAPPEPTARVQQKRVIAQDRVSRQFVAKPLEQQVAELTRRVQQLENQVAQLEQQRSATGTDSLSARLAALEAVVRIQGSEVEIVSPSKLTLRGPSSVAVSASGPLALSGSNVRIDAGDTRVNSVLRAQLAKVDQVLAKTVTADTVIAKNYTPGSGNVW